MAIDPKDLDLLGLSWDGWRSLIQNYYLGVAMGRKFFSDAVRHAMHRHGFTVIKYVDDFIGQRSYDFLLQLLCDLGLEVSVKKISTS